MCFVKGLMLNGKACLRTSSAQTLAVHMRGIAPMPTKQPSPIVDVSRTNVKMGPFFKRPFLRSPFRTSHVSRSRSCRDQGIDFCSQSRTRSETSLLNFTLSCIPTLEY